MTWPALPGARRDSDDRDRARAQESGDRLGPARVLRSAHRFVGLEHEEMRAVVERMPVRLHLHADLQLLGLAVDDVGDEVDADVERDADHRVGLVAAERRRAAMGDGVGEHHALARHLAPFDVAPPAGEDAHRAREVLILAGRLAILDDELLLLRSLPIGLGEVEVLDGALDAERVVQCLVL